MGHLREGRLAPDHRARMGHFLRELLNPGKALRGLDKDIPFQLIRDDDRADLHVSRLGVDGLLDIVSDRPLLLRRGLDGKNAVGVFLP